MQKTEVPRKSHRVQYVFAGVLLAFILISCIIYYWDGGDLMSLSRNGGVWVISKPGKIFQSVMDGPKPSKIKSV